MSEFLEQLESDLKDRYTETDEEYMACFNKSMPEPPILKIVCKKQRSYYQDSNNWSKNSTGNSYFRDNNYSYKSNINNKMRYSPYGRNKNSSHYNRASNHGKNQNDQRGATRDNNNSHSGHAYQKTIPAEEKQIAL